MNLLSLFQPEHIILFAVFLIGIPALAIYGLIKMFSGNKKDSPLASNINVVAQLEKLHELKEKGVISEQDYDQQKKRLLQ